MKCPKCGYNSFDHLENCKKCSAAQTAHKTKFGLRSLIFPSRQSPPAEPAEETPAESAPDGTADFGFDYMGGEESLDFDLNRDDDTLLPVLEEKAPLISEEIPEIGETSPEGGDEKSARESRETPEQKEPGDPFERGGDAGRDVSPGNKPFRAADRQQQALPEEEESSGLAAVFLGSLGENDGDGSDQADVDLSIDPSSFGDTGLTEASGVDPSRDSAGVVETGQDPLLKADLEWAKQLEVPEAPPENLSAPMEADEPSLSISSKQAPTPFARPSLSSRLGAGATDLLILALIFTLFLTAGQMTLAFDPEGKVLPSPELLTQLAIPYFLVLFSAFFCYFTFFHFIAGQTPGKMIFGLRVETGEGSGLLLSQAFLRSVGGLLSFLPAGLGYLRIIFDQEGRGWNDRLAGSRVVPVDNNFVRGEE